MSRTGMDSPDSHAAALTRCLRCSMLVAMSARLRIPLTVGISPTAVYGVTTIASCLLSAV